MKKMLFYLLVAVTVFFVSGCGYKFGSLSHPQLDSVAVAPVANDTLAYNASAVLRGALCERFTTDGSLKLKSMQNADCIVYAKITDVSYQAIGYGKDPYGDDTFLANEWRCRITVEYSVVIPGRAKPLVSNRKAVGTTEFLNGPDMETSRNSALRQACFAASKTIISNITEGW